MKKVFHLCHSSKEEVLFRNHDDYNWGFNSYALALYKTESCSLADAHMSDHRHLISQTDSPEKMMRINRLSYTRHMNTKYGRRGPLGESESFITELDGLYRLIAALTYTMRMLFIMVSLPLLLLIRIALLTSYSERNLASILTQNYCPKGIITLMSEGM